MKRYAYMNMLGCAEHLGVCRIELLYMNGRPENLLITIVPVPPMALRPSVIVDGGMSNENDITERLKQISQSNASLRAELEEGASTFKRLVMH
ncbi:hypothetical protein Droror1_Dr00010409 [Drosera rotundifolia]